MLASDRGRFALMAGAIAAVTLAVYAPTFVVPYDFISYDDPLYVSANPAVQSGLNFRSVRWAMSHVVAGNWHPLTVLSHMCDAQLYGLEAGGHHFTNVLLHAANGVLLFWVLWRMSSDFWPSALAAALFAWHPQRVESVAWISERKDVLSTFFMLAALVAYTRYAQRGGWRSYAATALLFGLGLLSKPMLVTFPFALLLVDVWPLRRWRWLAPETDVQPRPLWYLVAEKVPLLALAAVFIATTVHSQTKAMSDYPFGAHLANAVYSYYAYGAMMIWPHPLYMPYLFIERQVHMGWVWAGGVGLGALTVGALLLVRRLPYVTVGWLWYLGTLVPVIGLVQVGEQAMADRYTYIPSIGLVTIVAWSLRDLAARGAVWRRAVVGASLVAVAACVAVTAVQVTHWRNSETLFRHTLDYAPRNHSAYQSLSAAAYSRKEYGRSLDYAVQAIVLDPRSGTGAVLVARALARVGQTKEAVGAYEQAIGMSSDPSLQMNLMNELARIHATCEDPKVRDGRAALRWTNRIETELERNNPTVLDTMAAAYAELGLWDQAVETVQRAAAMAQDLKAIGNPEADKLMAGLNTRLALYKQRKPYRVPTGVWDE